MLLAVSSKASIPVLLKLFDLALFTVSLVGGLLVETKEFFLFNMNKQKTNNINNFNLYCFIM